MSYRTIPIEQIQVGSRRREDIGDIDGLADSINERGLIHPIVVDAENRLVAGGRRLAACESLGWTEIEVKDYGALTERELRLLELEENVLRKDLSDYERSKTLAEYAEEVGAQIAEESVAEVLSESDKTSNKGGRPKKGLATQRQISERTGLKQSTISTAQTHATTVDAFPFMQSWGQSRVLEAKKLLDQLPEDEHDNVSGIVTQSNIPAAKAVALMQKMVTMPPEERSRIYQQGDSLDTDSLLKDPPGTPKNSSPVSKGFLGEIDIAINALQRVAKSAQGELLEDLTAELEHLRELVKRLKNGAYK